MKARGSYKPQPFEFEKINDKAVLHFYENIIEEEVTKEGEPPIIGWRFDRYTIERPNDSGLISRIEGELSAWLELAKNEERKKIAAEIRARRNKLLQDTDITQLVDAPVSAGEQEAYRQYRQILREIPEQPGFPYEVEFPELELSVAN